jgi:hypothetical protein
MARVMVEVCAYAGKNFTQLHNSCVTSLMECFLMFSCNFITYEAHGMTFDVLCTGTGNVLKVQNLLHICSEHYETEKDKEKDKDKQQGTVTLKQ